MNCLSYMYILSWFLLQRKGVSLDNTSMFLKAKSFHCYHYSIWDWDVSQLSNVSMAGASPVSQFVFCFFGDSSPRVDCTFNVTQRNDCLVDVWLSRLFKILKGSDWEIWQQFNNFISQRDQIWQHGLDSKVASLKKCLGRYLLLPPFQLKMPSKYADLRDCRKFPLLPPGG